MNDHTAAAIHYPECWDTAAYPTLESALSAVYHNFKCQDHTAADAPNREAGDGEPSPAKSSAVGVPSEPDYDWPEDFDHENGRYYCKCSQCDCTFIGHKRRVVCRKCANQASAPDALKVEAWLIERADHKGTFIDGVVLSPLTDDTFLDEGDCAHALVRQEQAADALAALKSENALLTAANRMQSNMLKSEAERIAELESELKLIKNVETLDVLEIQRKRIAELESQLPDGMKHCTIQFKECEKGHGWLTATNWIQHDCQGCRAVKSADRIAALEAQIAGLIRMNADDVAVALKETP